MDNESEFYTFEDRAYIQPTLSSGEQEAFIDNLRNVQNQNNAQIAQQTHNLGTDVPSNLGGLGGGEAYFNSRYQTPQMLEQVNTLKSAAQAQALSDVMTNYQNQLQNRYKQAYRKAQKRAAARQRALQNAMLGGNPATKGNVNETSREGTPNIWSNVSVGDDEAFYGLNRLTRNPGESDADWRARATRWGTNALLQYKLSDGKFYPTRISDKAVTSEDVDNVLRQRGYTKTSDGKWYKK